MSEGETRFDTGERRGMECRPFQVCTRLDRNPWVVVIVCAWEEDVLDRRARLPTADADLRAGCIELGSAEYHDRVEHSYRLGSSLELLVRTLRSVTDVQADGLAVRCVSSLQDKLCSRK